MIPKRWHAALFLVAGLACGGDDPPPPPAEFIVSLQGSVDAGLVLLTITGPSAPSQIEVLGGYEVAWATGTSGTIKVIVRGDGVIGDVAKVKIQSANQISSYSITVDQVVANAAPYGQLPSSSLTVLRTPAS